MDSMPELSTCLLSAAALCMCADVCMGYLHGAGSAQSRPMTCRTGSWLLGRTRCMPPNPWWRQRGPEDPSAVVIQRCAMRTARHASTCASRAFQRGLLLGSNPGAPATINIAHMSHVATACALYTATSLCPCLSCCHLCVWLVCADSPCMQQPGPRKEAAHAATPTIEVKCYPGPPGLASRSQGGEQRSWRPLLTIQLSA